MSPSCCMLLSLLLLLLTNHVQPMRPTALVTGSTDGIGVTTAKNLCAKGYNVLIHGRDPKRIAKAVTVVKDFAAFHSTNAGSVYSLPAADLSTVCGSQQLASDVTNLCHQNDLQLSVVMNNAGVFSDEHVITNDGLELTFAVNVVAPFVITSRLLPLLPTEGGRIVIASSISQCRNVRNWDDMQYANRPYSAHSAYSESKLLDAMLTIEIADRLKQRKSKTTCNCLDPGTVNTKMLLAGWGPCGIDVEDALDETWLCSSEEVNGLSGKYFVYQSDRRAQSDAYSTSERAKLWSLLSLLDPVAAEMWITT